MQILGNRIVSSLLVFFVLATVSWAGEGYGRLSASLRSPTPYYVGNPKVIPPKVERYTPLGRKVTDHSAQTRAYPYGYFGAQTRTFTTKSSGYYNDCQQTSFRQGY